MRNALSISDSARKEIRKKSQEAWIIERIHRHTNARRCIAQQKGPEMKFTTDPREIKKQDSHFQMTKLKEKRKKHMPASLGYICKDTYIPSAVSHNRSSSIGVALLEVTEYSKLNSQGLFLACSDITVKKIEVVSPIFSKAHGKNED